MRVSLISLKNLTCMSKKQTVVVYVDNSGGVFYAGESLSKPQESELRKKFKVVEIKENDFVRVRISK